jgi:hypothetical protein
MYTFMWDLARWYSDLLIELFNESAAFCYYDVFKEDSFFLST